MWRAALTDQPRPGRTKQLSLDASVNIGFNRDGGNRKRKFSEVCVTVARWVVDRDGNILHPSGRPISDRGCADVPRDSVAVDLSVATAPTRSLPTTRSVWVCPDGPVGDCFTVEREGPVVRFRASWLAVAGPEGGPAICLDDGLKEFFITSRPADSSARLDGLRLRGEGTGGDGQHRITHFRQVQTPCP